MNTIKCTTTEFATMHNVDYATAAGFLRFMQTKHVVTIFGQRPNPTGKGKSSTIYEIPTKISLEFN